MKVKLSRKKTGATMAILRCGTPHSLKGRHVDGWVSVIMQTDSVPHSFLGTYQTTEPHPHGNNDEIIDPPSPNPSYQI